MRRLFLLAGASLVLCAACSDNPHSNAVTRVTISLPEDGWASEADYSTNEDGSARLTLDGVVFELAADAQAVVDFEALGVEGLDVAGSIHFTSTEPLQGSVFSVAGRAVLVEDGELFWGPKSIGLVSPGQRVLVTKAGLEIQAR